MSQIDAGRIFTGFKPSKDLMLKASPARVVLVPLGPSSMVIILITRVIKIRLSLSLWLQIDGF